MPELFDVLTFFSAADGPEANVTNTYPTDVDTVGANQVQARLQASNVVAGTYILTLSFGVNSMSQANNAIFIRFTRDSSIITPVWSEASFNVANAGDPLYLTQQAEPIVFATTTNVDMTGQMRKEAATGTLDLQQISMTLQRVN